MADFKDELLNLNDDDLVEMAERKVWLSSYAANNPRSKYHAECDAVYGECERREKPWLYQRGWNAAWVASGFELSESDQERATPAYYTGPKEPS